MNTVARPATALPGIFCRPTAASMAASYWSGPSMVNSGRRSRASRTAARTRSTSSPEPEAPLE